ncbi:hypothetical protein [Niabella hibiscisoli]|uniref:hypothetical protein n=1 Tax=Niabella hibiscisoli TaxID=1825928 RepID=UPI001F0FE859|nr:hypothetical protein [Niabella hibiscisoli]MCH5716760.1 hypothetical protein [Niabella hibiscisoli]
MQLQNPKLSKDITKDELLQITSNQKTISRYVEGDDCSYTPVYTYTNCNYSMGDTVVVVLCPTITYLKICSDLPPSTVPGTVFPPIGVGGTPSGTIPPGTNTSTDPCASAAVAMAKLNNTYQTAGIHDSIKNFNNLYTNAFEQGFYIIEKRTYDSQDNTKYTSIYYTSPVEQSPFTNSITLGYATKINEYIVGFVHTHPLAGAAGPSAVDIYTLAKKGVDFINSAWDPKRINYLGNFIMAADSSIYGLAVTNNAFALNFYNNTKSTYLDESTASWKKGSQAESIFSEAFNTFYKAYEGNSNRHNLAFEAAQVETLNKLNTGVTMVKYNKNTGNFEPAVQNIVPRRKDNGHIVVETQLELR